MGLDQLHALSPQQLEQNCGISRQQALAIVAALRLQLQQCPQDNPQIWRRISKYVLTPEHPFNLHVLLYRTTYSEWNPEKQGPPPVWIPVPEGTADTNAARFMTSLSNLPTIKKLPQDTWQARATGNFSTDWNLLHRLSVDHPEDFWPRVLRELRIKFHAPPSKILKGDGRNPDAVRWLPGAQMNIAESALSGRDPDRPAIVWADEEAPTDVRVITRSELAQQAQHVADALYSWGLRPGDAVAIDMPMVPEAVVAFLGIVLAGCVAVSIADSFAAKEIESRLRIAGAKAVFTQDVVLRGGKSLPLYERVTEAGALKVVVLPAGSSNISRCPLRNGDLLWQEFLGLAPTPVGPLRPHITSSEALSGILFSSGTTGDPKAIPWSHVTPLRCATDAFFHQDVRAGDTLCWPTSMGWMMGPWLVYAALLNGAAIALFTGAPLGRSFGEFVRAARVGVLGVVPSVVRAWRASDCMKGLNWRCLRCFSSTGEASAPDEYLWLSALGGYCPVIEYCGGTEIGGGFLSGSMLQPQAPATFSTPTMGARPVLLLADGKEVVLEGGGGRCSSINDSSNGSIIIASAMTGELALEMPMLGVSQRLLNADHAKVYFDGMPRAGLRRHGDEVQVLSGGYCRAHGRTDDTMNLGGIKVSSVELERAVAAGVQGVTEAAAVAVPPPDGGPDRLVLFLILDNRNRGAMDTKELQRACQAAISSRLNPLFKVGGVEVVAGLPRTASNKVMRRVLRDRLMQRPKM